MSPGKIVAKLKKLTEPHLKDNSLDFMEVRSSFGDRFGKGLHELEKSPRFKYYAGEDKLFMPAESRTLGLRDNITEDVLPAITQAKLSPQQLQAALAKTAGAKSYADEIGLTEFVKGRKSVTKGEIEAYVRENSPKLEVETSFFRDLAADEDTKFSAYQEPGGTNYREVKVKLPIKEGEPVFSDPTHFGDNVLLWLRVNDRIAANGKKVYFIEELQSN